MSPPVAIGIGASWGGVTAITRLLRLLSPGLEAVVLVVQHRGENDPDLLASIFDRESELPVVDAVDKEPLVKGRVYLAPAGYHLLVDERRAHLSCEPHVRHARPSVDVLFGSLAHAFGRRAVAVVLTGAGQDGADGAAQISAAGGLVFVQRPDEAEMPSMPRAALAAARPHHVGTIDELAALLNERFVTASTLLNAENPSASIVR